MVTKNPLEAAIAAWQAGDRHRAEALARRALRQAPDAVAALQILGAGAAERGDWRDAADLFDRAARLQPNDAQIRFNLAEALREAGDADAAITALRATIDAAPEHVPALVTLARLLAKSGASAQAMTLLDRAVAHAPDDARARLTRGEVRLALGRADALADLREACNRTPDFGYAQLLFGRALALAGDIDAADGAFVRALSCDPTLTGGHIERGKLAMLRHDPEAATTHYAAAIKVSPDVAETHALLGQAHLDLRAFDAARREIDQALAIEPGNAMARLVDAQLLVAGGARDTARDRLISLLADKPPPHIAVEATTELGHALDRLGDYRAAFARLEAANRLLAGNLPGDIEKQRVPARIAAIAAYHTTHPDPADAARDGGRTTRRAPVFLVGFPRSGTTLAEQVLASHGAFTTSGEAPLVDRVLGQLDPARVDNARGLGALSPSNLATLRETYWREAETRFPAINPAAGSGKRLVDKQPWNLIELPFIARLFPAARVIVMLRDPRDACLSAFMQYFALNPSTLHLLTLEDTVSLYEKMMGLWADWRAQPPLDAIEIRYEDLVGEFDNTVARLLEFVDEPWTDAVRDFQQTAAGRIISTPSRDAVTAPLTRTAVGRWRNYAEEMAPFTAQLAPFVDQFGYNDA